MMSRLKLSPAISIPSQKLLAPKITVLLFSLMASKRDVRLPLISWAKAVIRFKQGFGRLIRKEDDRGVICVLDRRIYEKRYGSQFINSLPVKKLYPLTVEEIAGIIEKKL